MVPGAEQRRPFSATVEPWLDGRRRWVGQCGQWKREGGERASGVGGQHWGKTETSVRREVSWKGATGNDLGLDNQMW